MLSVAMVAVASTAIWVWDESRETDPTFSRAQSPAPAAQPPRVSTLPWAPGAVNQPVPTASSQPEAEATSPDVSQQTTGSATGSTNVDPPDVDTPEPTQQKFARGGRVESGQI